MGCLASLWPEIIGLFGWQQKACSKMVIFMILHLWRYDPGGFFMLALPLAGERHAIKYQKKSKVISYGASCTITLFLIGAFI